MTQSCTKVSTLDDLRQCIAHLERYGERRKDRSNPLTFNIAAIDQHLPWGGLAPAALHEIFSVVPELTTPALGFATAFLGLAAHRAPVLWCQSSENKRENLYAPGLERFGLFSDNLIIFNAVRECEVLWVMEEALRSGALAAVLGEVEVLTTVSSRRLQLAAERGSTIAFLVRYDLTSKIISSATTRWQINTAISSHPLGPWPGATRWEVVLERCRGGVSGSWFLEWQDANNIDSGSGIEAGSFRLVTPLCNGSVYPTTDAANRFCW